MTVLLDQARDTNYQELHRFSTLYDLPDFVKQASFEDISGNGVELERTAFADPLTKSFPIHTKAAALVSQVFFLERQSSIPEAQAARVQHGLNKAASIWEIEDEVEMIRRKHAQLHTEVLSDSDYMYVLDGNQLYPLRNSVETKTAATWLLDHRDDFEYVERQHMAERLLRKSAQFCVALPEHEDLLLEQMAGRGSFIAKEAAQVLRDRADIAPRAPDEARDALRKLAAALEADPDLGVCKTTTAELCRVVDEFDREYGLHRQYSRVVPRPEQLFCGIGWKQARAAVDEAVELVTGHVFSKQALSTLPLHTIRSTIGNDIAEAMADGIVLDLEKAAEILPTLPRRDAEMFVAVAGEHNIHPTEKTASSVCLTRDHLISLAAASNG